MDVRHNQNLGLSAADSLVWQGKKRPSNVFSTTHFNKVENILVDIET